MIVCKGNSVLVLVLVLVLLVASVCYCDGYSEIVDVVKKEECEQNYGFLPCSTNIPGNIFLLVVYGFLMLKAAQLLSEGSEMLLLVLNPGLIGGLLLPILGALPDALLILVSGLFSSEAEVESQVLVGMGLLAGSTVMLLTLLWGSSVIVGRCDLYEVHGRLVAKDRTLNNGFDIFRTGVTTDSQTKVAAWIMVATVLPYILAQVPTIIGKPHLGRLFVILSCVLAFAALIAYCLYQVFSPWIQQRRIYLAKHRFRISHALHRVSLITKEKSWGDLFLPDGVSPNESAFSQLFGYFDEDGSGHLSVHELKALIVALGIGHGGILPESEEVKNWLKQFDLSQDDQISRDEFVSGFVKWMKALRKPTKPAKSPDHTWDTEAQVGYRWSMYGQDLVADRTYGGDLILQDAQESLAALMGDGDDDDDDEEEGSGESTRGAIVTKACFLIVCGAVIAGLFADPLVSAIGDFSTATGIPSFFVAFVATPLATNSSEAISSILFAAKKRKRNISLTYSQIYGGVTMNNTLCVGIFLAIVVVRGLTWDFSSEVLVIAFVVVAMGIISVSRTTFTLWMSFIALALYPLSIAIVAVLDYVFGWR